MKKLIGIILTLVFSMALFTGCTGGNDNPPATDPTPEPTPVVTPADGAGEEDSSTAYETVLAMWRDMDGYWANANGGYIQFTKDDEGKAVLYEFDRHDAVLSFAKAVTVEASNKTAYVMEFDYPEMKTDALEQTAKKGTYVIEIAGFADGYIELTDADGNKTVFVKVGKDLEDLYDKVQLAKDLSKQ